MRTPYRIESIRLHEVGVFDDLRIDFPPVPDEAADANLAEIHVFTGPNGCGKSTLLYALAAVFEAKSEAKLFARRKRHTLSYVVGRAIGTNVLVGGDRNEYEILNQPEEIHSTLFVETNQAKPAGLFRFYRQQLRTSPQSALLDHTPEGCPFVVLSYSGQRSLHLENPTSIQEIGRGPLDGALSFVDTVQSHVLLQWIANNRTQSALARADGSEAEAAQYDRSLARITGFIRDVCDLDLNFRLQRQPLAVVIRQGDVEIDFDGLPDGLKSIISWVGDLCVRLEAIPWAESGDPFSQPVILLLDEVDIHLHPAWQRRILPALQKLLPQGQVFVSTHSPFVVGSVQNAWIYRLPEPGKPGPQVVTAIPSGAGKSYRLILEEVFGINAEFDVETERLLAEFYAARATLLQNHQADPTALRQAAAQVTERSEEAGHIVAREIRQLQRLTQRELSLA
jgi:energy-coupling factor transporter ATP-binding protein EcfA2